MRSGIRRRKKRFIALFLACLLGFMSVGQVGLAEEYDFSESENQPNIVGKVLQPGDKLIFGSGGKFKNELIVDNDNDLECYYFPIYVYGENQALQLDKSDVNLADINIVKHPRSILDGEWIMERRTTAA